MFIKWRKKIAQSTTEYAILLGVIITLVAAMQTYVKRSFQAKIKNAADTRDIGGGVQLDSSIFKTSQYEPYYLQSQGNRFSAQREEKDYAEGATTINTYQAAGRDAGSTTTYELESTTEEKQREY